LVSLPGQALAAQTLSIKGREERVKEMGVMSSSVHSPGDHDEESLPLPPGWTPENIAAVIVDSCNCNF